MWHWHAGLWPRANEGRGSTGHDSAEGTAESSLTVKISRLLSESPYSLADKTLTIKVEHSTFPNWIGTDQKRTITTTGDEMKWTNLAGSGGGVVELVLKRAK
jgi:hypothetical protein